MSRDRTGASVRDGSEADLLNGTTSVEEVRLTGSAAESPSINTSPQFSSSRTGDVRWSSPNSQPGRGMLNQEVSSPQELGECSDGLVFPTVSPMEEVEDWRSSSQDGDLALHLDRRWVAWHQFMKEHAHLDAWLRLAEQAARSCCSAHVTYTTAKEKLRRVERLQYEGALRLAEVDGLTYQNRHLGHVFDGAVWSRLLALARDVGRRWDDLAAALDVHGRTLKGVVSEREEFEEEVAELGLWLADVDARLSELEHQTGNGCSKMKELQSFQTCVCESSQRVNVLLERGETMMQHCSAEDAQEVESSLLCLLHRCTRTFSRITSTHTRLLSMRLVFEDDCILPHAPDSGCPSESLLDEEWALDKPSLDLHSSTPNDLPSSTLNDLASSALHDLPSTSLVSLELELEHNITSCRDPTNEHLGLEWDPSVDIGRSVTHDNEDSSYFSLNTDVCAGLLSPPGGEAQRQQQRRHTPGSRSDFIDDITDQEVYSVCEPISFDGGRVRAWLGVQSSTPSHRTTCSRGVQTDGQSPACRYDNNPLRDDTLPSDPALKSPDDRRTSQRDWMRHRCQSSIQSKKDPSCLDEFKDPTALNHQGFQGLSSLIGRSFHYLLLAVALTLLAGLLWGLLETPCHRGKRFPPGHLALTYVNGPPPT